MKRAHKLNGQRLIVADIREHEMARRADIHLSPRPGTDLVWLSAITKYIIDQGKAKTDFIEQWVNKFDAYKESLELFTLEYAAQVTGLSQETLIMVAEEIIAAPSMCVLWAMGVTQHCGGSTLPCNSNLLLCHGAATCARVQGSPLRGITTYRAPAISAHARLFPGYEKWLTKRYANAMNRRGA